MSSSSATVSLPWRLVQWSLDQLFTCLRLLLDFTSDKTFQTLASFRTCPRLPPAHNNLLLQSANILAKKIRERKLKSETLVRAYIDRIREVQPYLSVAIDDRFNVAIEEAQKVDRILSSLTPAACKQLKDDMPLLGIPFSTAGEGGLKIKGLSEAEDDTEEVAMMRKSGAIPVCVTSVCDQGLWRETTNLSRTSNNPYSAFHTAGGILSAEPSLQSSAGVPLSIGKDRNGLMRTAAAFCGIFAHCPTPGLTANNVGPLCRFADDLKTAFEVLVRDSFEAIDKLSLDKEVALSQLRIYYLQTGIGDSFLVSPVSPQVRQSMMRVVCFLEDSVGVVCKPASFPLLKNAVSMYIVAAAEETEAEIVEKQSVVKPDNTQLTVEWLKWMTSRGNSVFPDLIRQTFHRFRGFVNEKIVPILRGKYDSTNFDLETLKNELRELLGDDGVLLCPAHPTRVPYHEETILKPLNGLYANIFSIVGMPVTTVPLGLDSHGLPLGVQVIASPYNDRLTLALAQQLERPFGGWIAPFKEHFSFYE